MTTDEVLDEAIGVLQELGLKEYEAKCFVGLSRLSMGTAKQLSEITDVPRTRVYDAIRVLEAHGLVEIQHSSPQRFRSVPLEEAIETLRDKYEERLDRLEGALERTEPIQMEEQGVVQEVWSLTGGTAITNRTRQLIADANDEVVLVIGDESILTSELIDDLNDIDEGVVLLIGAVEPIQETVRGAVPNATTFISGLDWLHSDNSADDLAIGRLLLVDRSTILVSTIESTTEEEHAIFGGGFRNGLVVMARRLMATGLLGTRDPMQQSD